MPPLFSVLMPAYRHAAYIDEAVQSVLSQTVDDLELIVIDDASPDATWQVLQKHLGDPRLRTFRHASNQGAHATLNEGLQRATGRHIAIINSDDVYPPHRLERCLTALEGGADLVGTDIQLIDDKSVTITSHWWIDSFRTIQSVLRDTGDWAATLLFGNLFMTTSNFVLSRDAAERLGPFRDYRFVHDYDYVLRAAGQGLRLHWINDELLQYRLHPSNTISDAPLLANLECAKLLRTVAGDLLGDGTSRQVRFEQLAKQWSRLERYMTEILLAQQHTKLVEQEANWRQEVDSRDRWIAERDAWIAERDAWIAERDAWIAERDQAIAARDHWIADRDQWIEERDAMLREQANALDRYRRHFDPILNLVGWRGARYLAALGNALNGIGQRAISISRAVRRNSGGMSTSREPPVRVGSVDELRTWLQGRVDDIQCVSFDVFDTLLSRCIEPPEWLHGRTASLLAEHLDGEFDADHILATRREVEHGLRQSSVDNGGDHECHFDPLVKGWVVRLLGHEDEHLEAFIHATERELEGIALYAKPGIVDLLQFLRQNGIRVIAASDMYLGHDHVKQLLEDCGLAASIDALYVSADFGVGKYTGRLHAKALESEGLSPETVVHVGDNLTSDMMAPCNIGMRGIFLDERHDRIRRRQQQLSAEMSRQGGIWPGRMLCEIVAERLAQDPEAERNDPFFQIGLSVLGPLYSTFMLGLIERLRAFDPQRIFFLARDGFLFRNLYESCRHPGGLADGLAPSTYLYVSRRILANAAIAEGMTLEQARVAFYNPKQQGMLSICRTYGLDPARFEALARMHGIHDFGEPLHDWSDPRLLSFLADPNVQQHMMESGRQAKSLLHDYLRQNGFFSVERVAFVDIGWNGTIQRFLCEAYGNLPGFPSIRGYYYALSTGMHGDFDGRSIAEGLMADSRRNNPCERAPYDFEELFEQGARSMEATTIGYRRDDGQVAPVLKSDDAPDRRQEIESNAYVSSIQDGVERFFLHFLAARRLTGFDFDQLRPYARGLAERIVVYPERDEVRHLGMLTHTEDFGHDHVLDLKPSSVTLRDILRPRRLYARIRMQAWRYASFSGFHSPWSAWIVRILHLKAVQRKAE
jgi:glycosyltransferase involved in cell wall biosynthesis/FMN phosphatase YigB (HAD superfamily)